MRSHTELVQHSVLYFRQFRVFWTEVRFSALAGFIKSGEKNAQSDKSSGKRRELLQYMYYPSLDALLRNSRETISLVLNLEAFFCYLSGKEYTNWLFG